MPRTRHRRTMLSHPTQALASESTDRSHRRRPTRIPNGQRDDARNYRREVPTLFFVPVPAPRPSFRSGCPAMHRDQPHCLPRHHPPERWCSSEWPAVSQHTNRKAGRAQQHDERSHQPSDPECTPPSSRRDQRGRNKPGRKLIARQYPREPPEAIPVDQHPCTGSMRDGNPVRHICRCRGSVAWGELDAEPRIQLANQVALIDKAREDVICAREILDVE